MGVGNTWNVYGDLCTQIQFVSNIVYVAIMIHDQGVSIWTSGIGIMWWPYLYKSCVSSEDSKGKAKGKSSIVPTDRQHMVPWWIFLFSFVILSS